MNDRPAGQTGVAPELERFVRGHHDCGSLCGDADAVTPDGYRLWIACFFGANYCSFERWVPPEVAEADLDFSMLPALPN